MHIQGRGGAKIVGGRRGTSSRNCVGTEKILVFEWSIMAQMALKFLCFFGIF